jgi:deoxycytidylate deaminase
MKKKHFNMLEKIADAVEPVGRQRLAACIVRGKRIVSIGVNKKKTHPIQMKFASHPEALYLHAEIDAIVNAREDVRGADMYVLRKMNNGQCGMAKPCEGCQRAIKFFGIRRVYWTKT